MRDFKLYLKDILEAMEAIEKFVQDLEFGQFKLDDKTSSAVIRKLEIIGEATKSVPEAIRQNYAQVPWKEMAGMRDKLIHFYTRYGLFCNVIASVFQRSNPLKIKRLLRQKAPR
ncbi:DUF86 domain-containing protein, partial [candidate division KSB1 bacterium]|nr:DUF86 domain-containing protein [candidate division KSB1 bacterium]